MVVLLETKGASSPLSNLDGFSGLDQTVFELNLSLKKYLPLNYDDGFDCAENIFQNPSKLPSAKTL